MDTVTIGPANGSLTLHTGVEGKAAKMGHQLTVALRDWEATATVDGTRPTSGRLRVALPSFEVVKGEGGLKPLSDKDRASIRDNALQTMKAGQHPEVVFTGDHVTDTPDGYAFQGELSIAGTSRTLTVAVTVTDAGATWQLAAQTSVVQSEYGVKPYSQMMGALRVSDRVELRFEAAVPKG